MKKKPDPLPSPDFFGQVLRTARLLRGYSLHDVRAGTGLDVHRLGRYEAGMETPDPLDFLKVWNFLSSDPPPYPYRYPHRMARP